MTANQLESNLNARFSPRLVLLPLILCLSTPATLSAQIRSKETDLRPRWAPNQIIEATLSIQGSVEATGKISFSKTKADWITFKEELVSIDSPSEYQTRRTYLSWRTAETKRDRDLSRDGSKTSMVEGRECLADAKDNRYRFQITPAEDRDYARLVFYIRPTYIPDALHQILPKEPVSSGDTWKVPREIGELFLASLNPSGTHHVTGTAKFKGIRRLRSKRVGVVAFQLEVTETQPSGSGRASLSLAGILQVDPETGRILRAAYNEEKTIQDDSRFTAQLRHEYEVQRAYQRAETGDTVEEHLGTATIQLEATPILTTLRCPQGHTWPRMTFCPFCGSELTPRSTTCPNLHLVLLRFCWIDGLPLTDPEQTRNGSGPGNADTEE